MTTVDKATETSEPTPAPKPAKLTLTSRAKMGAARTSQRGGKQIGAGAAKRQASAPEKPAKAVTKGKDATTGKTATAGAKATKAPRERLSDKFRDDMVITVLSATNPKPEASKPGKCFALYKTGMTVGQWRKKVVDTGLHKDGYAHLSWDTKHGFIQVKSK